MRSYQGIPGSIFELNKLLTLIKDRSKCFSFQEAEEAFLLLCELYDVSWRVLPMYCNWAMEWIVCPGKFDPDITPYLSSRATEPPQLTIHWIDASDPMGQPSLQAPPLTESLNIDAYVLYILLHGRPGSSAWKSGLVRFFAFFGSNQQDQLAFVPRPKITELDWQ